MLRVRLASFFAGAAAAAAGGGYFLYKDYRLAHDSMALKVCPPTPFCSDLRLLRACRSWCPRRWWLVVLEAHQHVACGNGDQG